MKRSKLAYVFVLAVAVLVFFSGNLFAFSLECKYFNVKVDDEVDIYQLLKKLNIDYFRQMDFITSADSSSPEGMLGSILDALYLEVSDVLDIHMYNFKINLEVLPDKEQLGNILDRYLGSRINVPSYYFFQKNTIYISFKDLRTGILAHEIAHAILSKYFAVPPPERVQEILSGYVEYSINKAVNE